MRRCLGLFPIRVAVRVLSLQVFITSLAVRLSVCVAVVLLVYIQSRAGPQVTVVVVCGRVYGVVAHTREATTVQYCRLP